MLIKQAKNPTISKWNLTAAHTESFISHILSFLIKSNSWLYWLLNNVDLSGLDDAG